jgi:hypothetical protein
MQKSTKLRPIYTAACLVALGLLGMLPLGAAFAQKADSGFALQVSPSPIVQTVKPGESTTVEVQIRNTGSHSEQLKMGLRAFTVVTGGDVKLSQEPPKDVSDWVTFADPQFDVEAGKAFVQKVSFAVPSNAGFSYSFAIIVSRQNPTAAAPGKAAIEGSVAIFTLLSVDKPGATRKIDVLEFSSSKHVYEYLPASFSLKLKNSGNSISKPTGTVFIQKTASSNNPLASLSVNQAGAYLLPDVTRSVEATWSDGSPVYKTDSSTGKKSLSWNLTALDKFRFGRYYAQAVVVYNDGVRDIPVQASLSFWVIPWKLIIGAVIIVVLLLVGLITTLRKTARLAYKKSSKNLHPDHTNAHQKAPKKSHEKDADNS